MHLASLGEGLGGEIGIGRRALSVGRASAKSAAQGDMRGSTRSARSGARGGSRSSPRTIWQHGCDGRTSVSGNGRYRESAGDEIMALATCAWRGFEIVTLGAEAKPLLNLELPASYRVRQSARTWTGRRIDYAWTGGDVSVELRTTLPGPLLATRGTSMRLRWPSGAEPQRIEDLADGGWFDARGLADAKGHRCWLAQTPNLPVLIVASVPVRRITVVSHMHWQVDFTRKGGGLMIVPLLSAEDAPRTAARLAMWLALAEHPPLRADERFGEREDAITISCIFPGATLAPLPPFLALLDPSGTLARSSQPRTTLLSTWCGPFAVVDGPSWTVDVDTRWIGARLEATRAVAGALTEAPEELAYAGDATWEPGTAMDQLLALRTWAPLIGQVPDDLRAQLIARLAPPDAAALRAGVERIVEPASKRPWARLRQMWDHNGDACYDVDWYNGLALSGLARAVECGVPGIAVPALRTAKACRRQRADLAAYAEVFHDWALCSAWSDPRGWMWNADCVHNGLEGLLAEARLRVNEDIGEGDRAGAARLRYLAARTAIGLLGSLELPAWIAGVRDLQPTATAMSLRLATMTTWSQPCVPLFAHGSPGAADQRRGLLGVQALVSWREISFATAATRNPYIFAGNFPEWCALLRDHGDHARLAGVAKTWEREQPERYRDWLEFYLGADWRKRREGGDQEARVQASVFYNLAPEISFRRLILGEDADAIEARFATPLHLAEQVMLRAGMRLSDGAHAASRQATAAPRAAAAR